MKENNFNTSNTENKEIENILSSLKFKNIEVPELSFNIFNMQASVQKASIPSTYFNSFNALQKRFISLTLSIPLAISVFAVGFYFSGFNNFTKTESSQLALLEASNKKILLEIDSLENLHENK